MTSTMKLDATMCVLARSILMACLVVAPWFSVQAQNWPVKPVRMIAPYPPGGGLDVLGRQLAEKLAQQWGQPVIVENRPGSSTLVGTELVARAPADGYTILLTGDGTMTINPHLFAKLPYDPQKDFTPVTQLVLVELILTAHSSMPGTLPELVALARAKPGTINYGSFGSGSDPHLAFEMLKSGAKINLVHVAYKGGPQVVFAVVAGEVQLALTNIPTALPHLKAGRIKALAYTGEQRSPALPDVPTLDELGYPDVDGYAGYSLFAPTGTPREVVARIQRDSARVLSDPDFRDKNVIAKGYKLVASSPEEFAAYLRKDNESRARAVKVSGAKAE